MKQLGSFQTNEILQYNSRSNRRNFLSVIQAFEKCFAVDEKIVFKCRFVCDLVLVLLKKRKKKLTKIEHIESLIAAQR